ncbi:hypothetical protein [Herbaspirillum rubrisubalbicans]|uniref:hypothetical protein n=1 Tax=Herbaspirillum rubrisubalbicans TaxID=80842 RepID=UPI0011D24B1D|nr:hypothetical protein [Herbaspirillum rubrisubalbicans]
MTTLHCRFGNPISSGRSSGQVAIGSLVRVAGLSDDGNPGGSIGSVLSKPMQQAQPTLQAFSVRHLLSTSRLFNNNNIHG